VAPTVVQQISDQTAQQAGISPQLDLRAGELRAGAVFKKERAETV
jgi:hypothetical protein